MGVRGGGGVTSLGDAPLVSVTDVSELVVGTTVIGWPVR